MEPGGVPLAIRGHPGRHHREHPDPGPLGQQGDEGLMLDLLAATQRQADPIPTAKAATIPMGRLVPSAIPATAPTPTTARPTYRSGRAMYGEAMTTTAVASARRTAR